MHPDIARRLNKPIRATAESADFGPAYNGENYFTLTFRVPRDTPAIVGLWDLIPLGPAVNVDMKTLDDSRQT